MGNKYVLLTDMIASRKIEDIDTVTDKLNYAMNTVNQKYKKDISALLMTLKGIDEIGCVLNNLRGIYDIITIITDSIHPNTMRFAVCYGEVKDSVKADKLNELSGRAFITASNMIAILKSKELLFEIRRTWYHANDLEIATDHLVNACINQILLSKKEWSERQMQTIRAIRQFRTQKKVADVIGISQQGVSKILQSLKYDQLHTIEKQLNSAIELLVGKKLWGV